jgi:ATP-dependent helicase/nuclease subunit A
MTGEAHRLPENVIANQRSAADPVASVWVAANAGSGKTTVLVDRIIRLMLAGIPLSRILCLTFTRAAAAEMENRLFKQLGEWTTLADAALEEKVRELTGKPVASEQLIEARRLFARSLDAPGGLKIDTIHAFCQSLIGRFPLEADVAPHAAIMDERLAAELMADARNRVLASAHDEGNAEFAESLNRLVVQVDETGFDDIMAELTRLRGKTERSIEKLGGQGAAIRAIRRKLGLREGETRDAVIAAACADGAFDELGLTRAAAALERGSATDRARAATLRAWLRDPKSRPPLFPGVYREVFLTQKGTPRAEKGFIAKSVAADPKAAAALLAEQTRVAEANERLKAASVAEASADLLRLAAAVIAAYDEEKSARAVLDYDDLILKARSLLARQGGVSWVLFKLDGGIDHILIDEAQDTSPEQWEVVRALADEFFAGAGAREDLVLPRTLFVVGDEKQSIFSFQGADVAEFERMRDHFRNRAREARAIFLPLPLEFSFRSAPAVLKAVDLVFSREPAKHGVVPEGTTIAHEAIRKGHAGLVEIWPTEKPQEKAEVLPWDTPLGQTAADSPPARLAQRIAKLIKNWLDAREILPSCGRPIAPQDVMILVRRRGAFFDEMVRALKIAEVPVAGTDRMVLAEQLAVMDLMAAGRFALLPEDDLTLAAVLKGPLYGLSDDDLFALAHGRKGALWQALRSRGAENPRWQAAQDELAALLARADFTAPFEFYAELLGERGGRKRILARLGPEANDPIDEFLSLAINFAREHPPSLQGFLDWLSRTFIEVKRDLEEARHEVRVMTVHGAKGLEAPVVFLPDTCAVPDHRHNARVLFVDENLPPLWPVRAENEEAVCAAAREAERRRREEEYRRLLYVAMTRARDRLYICGYEGERKRPEGCWYDLIREALAGEVAEVTRDDGTKVQRLENPQTSPPKTERGPDEVEEAGPLPDWAREAPAPERGAPVPLAPSRPADEEPPAVSPLAGDGLAIRRGRITHRLLELLPALEPGAREAAARRYLARPVHGLDAALREAIARETLAILTNREFAPLFGPASRAEVPLAGCIGELVIAGQVDRLVVTGTEVQVVDYKTNRPVPARPDEAPVAYLKQMAAYRALLALIYPAHRLRCALLWTSAPLLMPLPDALLDPYAP